MQPELHEFIEKLDYTQDTLRALATRLPVDDAALDALIAETVTTSDMQSFVYVVMAALGAQRVVQGRHLAR